MEERKMLEKIPEKHRREALSAISVLAEILLIMVVPIHWLFATIVWIFCRFLDYKKQCLPKPILEVEAI